MAAIRVNLQPHVETHDFVIRINLSRGELRMGCRCTRLSRVQHHENSDIEKLAPAQHNSLSSGTKCYILDEFGFLIEFQGNSKRLGTELKRYTRQDDAAATNEAQFWKDLIKKRHTQSNGSDASHVGEGSANVSGILKRLGKQGVCDSCRDDVWYTYANIKDLQNEANNTAGT